MAKCVWIVGAVSRRLALIEHCSAPKHTKRSTHENYLKELPFTSASISPTPPTIVVDVCSEDFDRCSRACGPRSGAFGVDSDVVPYRRCYEHESGSPGHVNPRRFG